MQDSGFSCNNIILIVCNEAVPLYGVEVSVKLRITKKKDKEEVNLRIRDIKGIFEGHEANVCLKINVFNANSVDRLSTKSFDDMKLNSLKGCKV